MPRARIEFSKGDRVRFLSHLDLMKAMARAIRRAEIPIAFSEGFNPHPKMNFASAVAVGVSSESEYMDIELQHEVDIKEIIGRLARAMPPGLDIKGGRIVPDSTPALMAEVNRAAYHVSAAAREPVNGEELSAKIAHFLSAPEIVIEKRTKKGLRPKDIRPGITHFRGSVSGERVDFLLGTVLGSDGSVRPEEVVCAFAKQSGLPIECDSLYIRRISLYTEKDGKQVSPMEVN